MFSIDKEIFWYVFNRSGDNFKYEYDTYLGGVYEIIY